eukprot:10176743-Prorocentrum_lima.AAC.1
MVSEHIFQAFCQDETRMRAACETASAQGDPQEAFWRYAEHMRTTATQGGLLELSAACTVYCMQAVVLSLIHI